MKVDILPENCNEYECYHAVIVSLCRYLSRDFKLMFAGTWRFDYDRECDKDRIGPRLVQKDNNNFLLFLEQFHGIKTIKKKIETVQDIVDLVHNQTKAGMPVACHIDSYWLEWASNFGMVHYNHVILILSVNKEKNYFTCIDPYFSKKEEILPFDKMIGKVSYCDIFEIQEVPKQQPSLQCVLDIALYNLFQKNETAFDRIRCFAEDMNEILNLSAECNENVPFDSCTLMIELKNIRGQRMNFAQTLRFLAEREKNTELFHCALELENTCTYWKRLNYLLVKQSLRGNSEAVKQNILNLILQIADEERTIAVKLADIERNSIAKTHQNA